MNKIYLDKLLDFTHSTYSNYYSQYNKHFDLNDEITRIKQNTSLNEKGTFLKYTFVDLSSLISSIEYDECVLIYPLCFNIEEHQEWFNLLNCLLLILNDDYIEEPNITKKKILQIADKMYKKHLIIDKNLNAENYQKISELTNLNLIILNNENNLLKITQYSKPDIEKWVICYKFGNNYFPIWNFEKKYFDTNSNFVKYLQMKINKNISNQDILLTNTSENISEHLSNDEENNSENENKQINKIIDDEIIVKGRKNNDAYEEFVTNENYALYISEAVETANTKKQKVKKTTENIAIGEKKKTKTNKNIFVTLEHDNTIQQNKVEDDKNNNETTNSKKNKNENDTGLTDSVFKKTEKVNKEKISQIISNIKSTTKLEQIQAFALELGLSVISGSTRDGKPKNKTKNELVDEIKKMNS
jgi:hypothetical protein